MDRFSAHLDRGWDLIIKGDTTRALISARRALDIDEESPEVHNLLGYIHALDGDLDEALEHYRQAIELDEWYIDPLLNAAEILCHTDSDPEEAIRLCRRAAELSINDEEKAEAVLLEVDALFNLGDAEKAQERLLSIDDGAELPAGVLVLLARAHFDLQDLDKAESAVRRAIEHEPDNPDAWYYQGLIHRDRGLRVPAVEAFLSAQQRDDVFPPPPWTKTKAIEETISTAFSLLPDEIRGWLEGAEVHIEELPSKEQICREVDPRQSVLVEGIDPSEHRFEHIWVFTKNLPRAGATPSNLPLVLAELFHKEAGPSSDDETV